MPTSRYSTTSDSIRPGLLLNWTDVVPEAEAELNRWYDHEHMQERVAIEGFRNARRFRALNPERRRYLGLYETDSLDVFRSAAYQKAFTQQTDWSVSIFTKMRNSLRRVGNIDAHAGAGEGGILGMAFISRADGKGREDVQRAAETVFASTDRPAGVVSVRIFCPDAQLSKPIGKPDAPSIAPEYVVLAEGWDRVLVEQAVVNIARLLGEPKPRLDSFQLLWSLNA